MRGVWSNPARQHPAADCEPSAFVALPSASSSVAVAPTSVAFDGARARQHLLYFADPARGGRFTGSAGFEEAARYMADRFREIGLEPAGDDGTYFQRFPVNLVDLAGTPALSRTGQPRRAGRID